MVSHSYLPPGTEEVTFPPLPRPKLVLDLATLERCKAELTHTPVCMGHDHIARLKVKVKGQNAPRVRVLLVHCVMSVCWLVTKNGAIMFSVTNLIVFLLMNCMSFVTIVSVKER